MATHRCLGKQADTVVIEMWKPWSGVYPASSTHSGAELAAVEIDTSVVSDRATARRERVYRPTCR
jgi:hypothetical protein